MAMYFLGQNRQAPDVNYPQGDYRTISRLDRSRAEAAKNAQLEAELARKRAWEDELFQRKLAELQKNILAGGPGGGVGGGLGSGAQFAPQAGGQAGGMQTSMDRLDPLQMALLQNRRSTMLNYRPQPNVPMPGPADTPFTAQFGSRWNPESNKLWQNWIGSLMGRR